MKIKNTTITIDPAKIELHSTSRRNVELPYTGKLPTELESTAARIAFNVQPGRVPMVTLIVSHQSGKDTWHPVEATADEIKGVLQQIFDDTTASKPGLAPYWLGVWQANFNGWRETTKCSGLLTAIEALEPTERAKLQRMIKQIPA